jgi:hypothetical protein
MELSIVSSVTLKVVIAQQLKHFWTEAGFGLYLLYITC